MDVPELTREGHRFIKDLLEIYRETPSHKQDTVGKLATLKDSEHGNFGISEIPVKHPNYSELVTDTSKEYYLKARYPELWEEFDETKRVGSAYEPERPHGGYYQNECFGETRIWLEAKERGEKHMELFAPVIDYDGEDFSWTVMLKCGFMDSHKHRSTPYKTDLKKLGWKPHDIECGKFDNRKVAYDYGMWRRENDEWLVPEEDVFKDNSVFFLN